MTETATVRFKRNAAANWLIVVWAVGASSVPAYAQSNSNAASAAPCGGIADAAARLGCYDRANAPPRTPGPDQSQSRRWPEFNTLPSASPAAKPQTSSAAPSQHRKLLAEVTTFSFLPSHRFAVTLDNGQIWTQLEADDGVAQFRSHGPNRVVISRGFWKSYDLKLNDMSAVFKVQRVR